MTLLKLLPFFILSITIETFFIKKVPDFHNCRVKHDHHYTSWSGSPIKFISFVSYDEEPVLEFTFQGENRISFYDRLYLSSIGNKLFKGRGGIPEEEQLSSSLNATGWTEFQLKLMAFGQLQIYTWSHLALNYTPDYPIHSLISFASNITVCPEKTPSWSIEDGEVSIPLATNHNLSNPLLDMKYDGSIGVTSSDEERLYQISFYSAVPFSPKMTIEDHNIFFILTEETLAFSDQDTGNYLEPGLYVFHLQLNEEKVTISYIHEGEIQGSKDVKVNNRPKYLTIDTTHSLFEVSLRLSDISNAEADGEIGWLIPTFIVLISIAILVALVLFLYFRVKSKKGIKGNTSADPLVQETPLTTIDEHRLKKGSSLSSIFEGNTEGNLRDRSSSRKKLFDTNYEESDQDESRDRLPGLRKISIEKKIRGQKTPYDTI